MFRNDRRPAIKPALIFIILSGFLLVACGTQVAATNWPGMTAVDDRVYVAYGPGVLAINIAEENQLWSYPGDLSDELNRRQIPVTAPYYAAPSVSDGLVVIGDYGASGGIFSPGVNVSIYAINETINEDGVEIEPAWDGATQVQDRIIASPLQVNDQVFVGTADNQVLALDAATGSVNWPEDFDAGQSIGEQLTGLLTRDDDSGQGFEAEHSIWGQPSYEDGVLYINSLDKNVYALDSDTGRELWPTPGSTGGSISDKADLDGNVVYVGSFDGHVHAMDRLTGEILWSAPASAADSDNLTAVWGAPVFADGIVYFVDLNGAAYAVNADDGRQLWTQPLDSYATAAPVIFEDSVFIALAGDQDLNPDERQGSLVALETGSGKELWRQTTSAPVFSTPVIADDAVVIAYRSAETELNLEVYEPDSGDLRWELPLISTGEG